MYVYADVSINKHQYEIWLQRYLMRINYFQKYLGASVDSFQFSFLDFILKKRKWTKQGQLICNIFIGIVISTII